MENDNSEESNSAAAAREARRRRVLANTNKRLEKITGRVHNEEPPKVEQADEAANGIYPDPEFERDSFESMAFPSNGMPNQDVFELLKTLQQEGKRSSNQGDTTQQQQQQPRAPETPLSRVVRSKIPICIIALIVYTLHVLSLERFVGSSVFLLLILWEIFEFIVTSFFVREPAPQNQIVALISMFLGLNPTRIQLILKLLGLFNKILRDIAIFLFTFVLLHLAYSFGFKGESLNEILDKDFTVMFSSKNDEL